ncbi:hypothetical protein M2480_003060 [Parabacteroides sp. PFB2-12]|uniref:RagB/SusD family nutrient uptake outer membrane protein n=1 Tax=unclassified Parabacteroides TaxID=2649774 RepID=UPI002476047E|nr:MULTISPECIES: RagB/SusD family nutrient uptake outer membrane protein [unclassified Parabacteroides]MDH6344251.1 hypothetical protein [Parabacteroides sp. PM6-13]MDH6392054.1 hypothetical protein [Parabacteroides sp. PFB2-12]
MKSIRINLRNILAAGILLFTATSCEDFLSTPPANLLSSEGFYQTPSQSEQGVIGIYGNLRYLADEEYLQLSECRSDNVWAAPITDGLREYSEISTFRAGQDLITCNNAWNHWYKVIYDANVALVKIEGCDFANATMKDQFLGEAYFLRGWAYFELVRLFGNIPIIDSPMSPNEVKETPQSTAKEVYDKIIIPDLTTAKAKLPTSDKLISSTGGSIAKSGRADKMAASAMLARVYMTKAGFPINDNASLALAEAELKSVIDYSESNGNKYWAPNIDEWRKQWMPSSDYYNKYSIFAIQYRAGGTGNTAIFNFSPALPPSYTTLRIFGNSIWVEKTLMYEFDREYNVDGVMQKDLRGHDHSILIGFEEEPNWVPYSNATEEMTLADGSKVDVLVRTMFYKYLPTKRKLAELGIAEVEGDMKDYNDWPVNYPVLRYEDILLMYAEILATKDVAGAMKIVNRIRERAGCAPETASSSAEALAFVKRERRVELMGEGVRWFDLIRYGEWQTAIVDKFNRYNNQEGTDVNNVKNGRYLYPIPMNQINVNPGLYTQNEGY